MRIAGHWARALPAVAAGLVLTWLMLGGPSGEAGERASEILRTISSADPAMILLGAAAFCASILLRACRLSVLACGEMPFGRAAPYTATHIGLGHVLPLRLADVLLVGMLRGGGVPAGSGTGIVLTAKLLDLSSLGLVVLCALAAGAGASLAIPSAVALLGGIAGIAAMPGLASMLRPASRGPLAGPRAVRFLEGLRGASMIWATHRTRFLAAAGLSVLTWVAKLSMFPALAAAVGFTGPEPWQVFFAGAGAELIMALPVQGLFNLGIAEAGWTAGFALLGVTGEDVVTSGFSVHLIWLAAAVAAMLASLPFIRLRFR